MSFECQVLFAWDWTRLIISWVDICRGHYLSLFFKIPRFKVKISLRNFPDTFPGRWPLFSPQGHMCALTHFRVQPCSTFSLGWVFKMQPWSPALWADSNSALWLKKAQDHCHEVTYTNITIWTHGPELEIYPRGKKKQNTFLSVNFYLKSVAALYNDLNLKETSLLALKKYHLVITRQEWAAWMNFNNTMLHECGQINKNITYCFDPLM